jgi:plastocyanin
MAYDLWRDMVVHSFSNGRRTLRHCDSIAALRYFMPKAATIAPHAPIRWENTTGSHHTITHEGCERGSVCVFDSGTLAPDGRYELTGLPPGTYPYLCRLHPIMRGVLVVQESTVSDMPGR